MHFHPLLKPRRHFDLPRLAHPAKGAPRGARADGILGRFFSACGRIACVGGLLVAGVLGGAAENNYTIDSATDTYTSDLPERLFNLDYDPLLVGRSFQIVNRNRQNFLAADPEEGTNGLETSSYWATAVDAYMIGSDNSTALDAINTTWRLIPVPGKKDTYLIALHRESAPEMEGHQLLWLSDGIAKVTPNLWKAEATVDLHCQWSVTWDHDGWYRLVNLSDGRELADSASGQDYRAVGSVGSSTAQANLRAEWQGGADAGLNLWRFRASRKVASHFSQYRPGLMANLRYGPRSPMGSLDARLPAGVASVEKTLRLLGNYGGAELGAATRFALLAAHRGVYGKLTRNDPPVPENSILAIRHAAACGFESVELDVKLTKDGKLVLMHDYSTGRMMPATFAYSGSAGGMVGRDWDPRIEFGTTYVRPAWSDLPEKIVEQGDVWNLGDLWGTSYMTNVANPEPDMGSLGHWQWIDQMNPLVRQLNSSDFRGVPLWGVDRFKATKTFGTGRYLSYETTVTLQEALQYIADELPGLVVILDLRHKEEVAEAIRVIDQMSASSDGEDPRNWIILKPFGNALPAAFADAAKLPTQTTGGAMIGADKAGQYFWIPVVSGRLKKGSTPGAHSVRYYASNHLGIAQPMGPDVTVLGMTSPAYLQSWAGSPSNRVANGGAWNGHPAAQGKRGMLAIELAISPNDVTSGNPAAPVSGDDEAKTKQAYRDFRGIQRVPMIGPWRPADICDNGSSGTAFPFTGPFAGTLAPAVLGHAWKDDGLGIYAVSSQGYTTLTGKNTTCDILTVDLGERVMATYLKSGNRSATAMGSLVDTSTPAKAEPRAASQYGLAIGLHSLNSGAYLGLPLATASSSLCASAAIMGLTERFYLRDENGGDLLHGDIVGLRTAQGHYLTAVNGGGGGIHFDATAYSTWEKFKVLNISNSGQPIRDGDTIALRAPSGKHYLWVSADGESVNATAPNLGNSTKFTFVLASEPLPTPIGLRSVGTGGFLGALRGGELNRGLLCEANRFDLWERYYLHDINGGELRDGDAVGLRTFNGNYIKAMNGGGSAARVSSTQLNSWERLSLRNLSRPNQAVRNGDTIALRAPNGVNYLYARRLAGATEVNFSATSSRSDYTRFTFIDNPKPVGLRSKLLDSYLTAQGGGGAGKQMLASALRLDRWESLDLVDINGGELVSGDKVNIRTPAGYYVTASGGGGGALRVDATSCGYTEGFAVTNVSNPGNLIRHGDTIALQTPNAKNFVRAYTNSSGALIVDCMATGISETGVQFVYTEGPVWVGLRSQGLTKYLTAESGGGAGKSLRATSPRFDRWEHFEILDFNGSDLQDGDVVALRTYRGYNLTAVNAGGAGVNLDAVQILDWEKFTLCNLSRPGASVRHGDQLAIKTRNGSNFLRVQEDGTVDGKATTATGGAVFIYHAPSSP